MKMRKMGAVPIPYIIALVLGIAVIALIAYWLFFSGGEFGGIITEKACEAKKMAYCNELKSTGTQSKSFSADCDTVNANRDNYYAPECCRFDWAHGSTDICD